MLACTKIGIYEWFQQIRGWNRMDFLCGLVSLCNPFELRFIGSCIEDFAQNDYNCLRDQELKANTVEHLTQFIERNVHSNEFRSHVIMCLAMLHSTNYKVGTKLALILDEQLKQIDTENLMVVGSDTVIDECMLMLTLASHHPALSFEKKLCFRTKLMDYEKILHRKQMPNSRYGRCYRNPHPSAKYSNAQDYCAWVADTPIAHQFMSFPVCQNIVPYTVYANSFPNSSVAGNASVSENSNRFCTVPSNLTCDFELNKEKKWDGVREKPGSIPSVTVPTSNLEVSYHNYVNKPVYVHSSSSTSSQQPFTVTSRDRSIVDRSNNSTTTVTTSGRDVSTCTCSRLPPSVKILSKIADGSRSTKADAPQKSEKMSTSGNTNVNQFLSYPESLCNTEIDLTSTSAVPLTKEKGLSHCTVVYNCRNNVPEKISAKLAVTEQDCQRNIKHKLQLKVTWSNGKETECCKTEDDLRKFHELVTEKVRMLAHKFKAELPTKQTSKSQEVFDLYFNDVLDLPHSLLTCENILSFFQPSTVMLSQNLPLKKRKLKPDVRNRTRESTDNDESSSSSSVSPLPVVPKRNAQLLNPGNHSQSTSFAAITNVASVSLSNLASDSPTSLTEQNQELTGEESDTRNDEYLKLYYWLQDNNLQELYTHIKRFTFRQFVSLEVSQVNAIQGLSDNQKTVIKQLLRKLNSKENLTDEAALEIDMGKLVIATDSLLPSAKSKENSVPNSESEDDKTDPLQFQSVEFETMDSLHAVASNSCFSFEFDSSSATPSEKNSDVDTDSRRPFADENVSDPSKFSGQTALAESSQIGRDWIDDSQAAVTEFSQFSAHAMPYVYQQSSNQKLSYYATPQSRAQILVIPNLHQKFQCYQPCHPTSLAINTQMSNGTTISSPSQLCSPTFIAPPSQSQFPIVSSPIPKPVLLTYIPTSSYCSGVDCSTMLTTSANFPTYTMTSSATNPINAGQCVPGYYQAMDGAAHSRENSAVPQHPSITSNQNVFVPEDTTRQNVTTYVPGYRKPVTPLPVIPIYPGKNVPILSTNSTEHDTDSEKQSFASNDSDISTKMPGNADGQYFVSNGHNPHSPMNYYLNISPVYNPSPSQTNPQNDFVRGYHSVGSNSVPPLYFTPNGYQDTLYSMHNTQSMSGPPLAGGRDRSSLKHQVYCPGCGESGHWALDCGKESAVEVMGNSKNFQLNFSASKKRSSD